MTTNKKDIKYKIPKNFYKSFQKELSQDAKLIKELLTTDKLNKTENFNISKGNVKEDNINVAQRISQDDELMKKIFPHKEVINGKIVSVFPYIEEVYPLKDVPQEVVSKMETTTLTEQWKKGELKEGEYYIKSNKGHIYIDICANGSFMFTNYRSIEEVLAEVPSYEQWQSLNELLDSMQDTNKALAHKLNNIKVNGNYPDKISKLKSRIKGLMEKNEKLEELLKECRDFLIVYLEDGEIAINNVCTSQMIDKIDEVLE